jgi:two-component system sensor kinase
MIEDILAFSRVSTKGVRKAEINMEELTRKVFEELGPEIGDRKIRLVVKPLPPACGDIPMVRQVVVNVFSNAVKYTAAREEALIEVGGSEEGDENVYYVKDNGVGFETQFASKLFGLFQRLHTSKEFKGTGVGLAIVKRIIEKHGGRVWAEGKVDEGATFYFTLPGSVDPGNGCPPKE